MRSGDTVIIFLFYFFFPKPLFIVYLHTFVVCVRRRCRRQPGAKHRIILYFFIRILRGEKFHTRPCIHVDILVDMFIIIQIGT